MTSNGCTGESSRVKVLHATKVQGIGGAEQHLLALLPALRERGIDARFLSLDAGGDADRFHRALDERSVPWRRVPCGHRRLAAAHRLVHLQPCATSNPT